MILYLVRTFTLLYVLVVLMMTFIPVAGGVPIAIALPKAALYAGFIAAGMTWFEIHRKGLWPLYDNLRISRRNVFAGLIGSSVLTYAVLRAIL